jgi:uncharacterized flavoprotein (TIGR03862 family)
MSDPPRNIAIIGAGPAGLFAAETLASQGLRVDLYDRMPSPARKFLMAGRGGLNLTHSEDFDAFLSRYAPKTPALSAAIQAFTPDSLRDWAAGLGQETFIGSSGRVFPKVMKASPLLRAWLGRLDDLGVTLHTRHEWQGWNSDGALRFRTQDGERCVHADATLLALGGASWPRLGSDGGWSQWLEAEMTPFAPANSGVYLDWSEVMRRHAGTPLKRITASIGGKTAEGEAIITETGLEGGVIYALSRPIRQALERHGEARLVLDLRPDFRPEWIAQRLAGARAKDSLSSKLRKAAGLQPTAVTLLFEGALAQGGLPKDDPVAIAARVRALPLRITGLAGLDRAISTAGGVRFDALTPDFMLKSRPGTFIAGEMLDWEAPTGGYLLQACFATGKAAAEGVMGFLPGFMSDAPEA